MWVLYSDGLKRPAPLRFQIGEVISGPFHAQSWGYFFSFVCHESDESGDLSPEFHPVMSRVSG
jgi:hypothetical protein